MEIEIERMEKTISKTLISGTSDYSRDGKQGQGRHESGIPKSNQPLKNLVLNRRYVSYDCPHCGVDCDTLALLKVHYKSCAPPLDSDDGMDKDEDDDDDDDYIYFDIESISAEERKSYDSQARSYSERALKYLNELDDGKKFELIEAGPYHAVAISRGAIFHLNLKAKQIDCPGAEVETFFAQARMHPGFQVDFCVSLGPTQNLPRKPFRDGCGYCLRWHRIHHPRERHPKFIRGVKGDDVSWLYGDNFNGSQS